MPQIYFRDDCPRISMIHGANLYPEMTDAELRMAARYDMIASRHNFGDTEASRQKVNDHVKRLHEMNPRIIVLHATTGACEAHIDNPLFTKDCFLKTPQGEFIGGWPGTVMLNLSKQKTIDGLVEGIIERTENIKPDGFYIDCMGGAFDSWAVELETGRQVDIDANEDGVADDMKVLDEQWKQGKINLMQQVRERIGWEPYILTNCGMDHAYAKPYSDGNIFEGILDNISVPNFYANHKWDRILEGMKLWGTGTNGRPNCTYIDITPLIDCDYHPEFSRPFAENSRLLLRGFESLRLMRYGLTTTMLTDIHFAYQMHTRVLGQFWWYSEYDLPVGKPLGPCYAAEDGSWRREYENAVVVVNFNYHEIQPHFEHKMRDCTTSLVGQDFDIPSQDGRIFMRLGL